MALGNGGSGRDAAEVPRSAAAMRPAAPQPGAEAREAFDRQGSDPDKVKTALEDSTSLARNLWISFLLFGTYFAITVSGVTHEQLFRESPITLPVLDAGLPLVTFFWLAPILFVIFHLYLLINLKLLADQAHHYEDLMAESALDDTKRDRARLQLPNFVIVQMIGGTREQRRSLAGRLLALTALITLVVGPVVLLMLIQLQFLPYHHLYVTWAQRIVLLADLFLIWWFWPAIRRRQVPRWALAGRGVGTAAAIYFSSLVLTFPGEPQDDLLASLPAIMVNEETVANWSDSAPAQRGFFTLYEAMFGVKLDPDRHGEGLFSNRLVLNEFVAIDRKQLKEIEEREKGQTIGPGQGEPTIRMPNRDFRNADFRNINLQRADLRGGHFEGANLSGASLQGAWLGGASLQGASLDFASLQGASLDWASLQGASLFRASMQGASLGWASLQGAALHSASMQGALLNRASLQGASLDEAWLQGASLDGASMQGASLDGALLQGASLDGALLRGASLDRASLQGASLDGALLQGATLDGVRLWRTSGFHMDLGETLLRPEPDLFIFSALHIRRVDGPQYHRWWKETVSKALKDVPSGTRASISKRLVRLAPDALSAAADGAEREALQRVARQGPDDAAYRIILVRELAIVACQAEAAPYVARRLTSRIEAAGTAALPIIHRMLDPVAGNCPGAVGLDQDSLRELGRLKAAIGGG